MIYHPTPRVQCETPLGTQFPDGTTVFPVRARDDLDPHDPPLEYEDGRLNWSGYDSREKRDDAMQAAEDDLARRRASRDLRLIATRVLLAGLRALAGESEALRVGTISAEHYERHSSAIRRNIWWAREAGGSEALAYAAGCCWYPHASSGTCAGCVPPPGQL